MAKKTKKACNGDNMKSNELEGLLKELQEKWPIIEEVSFNELNIQEKLQEWPFKLVQYHEQFLKEKSKLYEINELKTQEAGKIYDNLRFHSDKQLTKQEIETYYIPREPSIIKLNKAIEKQAIIVEYFSNCVDALKKITWSAKLFHEDRRFN
jgi:hypothetical protein